MILWDAYCYMLGFLLKAAFYILSTLVIGFIVFGIIAIPITTYQDLKSKNAPIWARILLMLIFVPLTYAFWGIMLFLSDSGFDLPYARIFAR